MFVLKSQAGKPDLRGRLAAALICALPLFAVGCGSPSDKLIGKWKLDTQAFSSAMSGAMEGAMPGGEGEEANPLAAMGGAFLQNMLGSIEVTCEFQAGGGLIVNANMAGAGGSKSGTWKYVRSEGENLVVSIAIGQDPPQEKTITFTDPDTIQMGMPAPADGAAQQQMFAQSGTFRRVKP